MVEVNLEEVVNHVIEGFADKYKTLNTPTERIENNNYCKGFIDLWISGLEQKNKYISLYNRLKYSSKELA